jgi:hypothetical protein
MDLNDIITLAKAGYNAEQIAQLHTLGQKAPVAAPVASVAEPIAAPVAATVAPVAAPVAAPIVPIESTLDKVNAQIAQLLQTVQAQALNNTSMPQHTETTEDILAQIIAPQPKAK